MMGNENLKASIMFEGKDSQNISKNASWVWISDLRSFCSKSPLGIRNSIFKDDLKQGQGRGAKIQVWRLEMKLQYQDLGFLMFPSQISVELPSDFIRLLFPGRPIWLLCLSDPFGRRSRNALRQWECFLGLFSHIYRAPSIWRLWKREGARERGSFCSPFPVHSSSLGFK